MKTQNIQRIIISRTDSIGDVVLTLPTAALLRKAFPGAEILFLGSGYTRAVVEASTHVDRFIEWAGGENPATGGQIKILQDVGADLILHVFPVREIAIAARSAGIPYRVGTTGRWYHWRTCNRLVRMSRRRSDLHEAQLNIRLTRDLVDTETPSLQEISTMYGMTQIKALGPDLEALMAADRKNVILHPGSRGSARNWSLDHFAELAGLLVNDGCKVFITGTAAEGQYLAGKEFFTRNSGLIDLTGRMGLDQLIAFIQACDGLVAASTGPLHIAAALGIRAVGIYPPIRPMHPGRWAPLGPQATYLVSDRECNDCRSGANCHCMNEITAQQVFDALFKEFPGQAGAGRGAK